MPGASVVQPKKRKNINHVLVYTESKIKKVIPPTVSSLSNNQEGMMDTDDDAIHQSLIKIKLKMSKGARLYVM